MRLYCKKTMMVRNISLWKTPPAWQVINVASLSSNSRDAAMCASGNRGDFLNPAGASVFAARPPTLSMRNKIRSRRKKRLHFCRRRGFKRNSGLCSLPGCRDQRHQIVVLFYTIERTERDAFLYGISGHLLNNRVDIGGCQEMPVCQFHFVNLVVVV